MKKRWLLVLSLAICAILLFSACLPLDKKALQESKTSDTLEVSKLSALDGGYSYVNSQDSLAIFQKVDGDTTVIKIVNINSGAVVYTKTEAENESVSISNDMIVFAKQNENNSNDRYTIYDNTGRQICADVKEYRFINDCLVYDSVNVVRVDKETGEVKETYTRSEFDGEIPSCYDWTDNYYYNWNGGSTVDIYDKHYVRVTTYTLPGYVEKIGSYRTFFILNDGTVIAQGMVPVDILSEKYDLLIEGEKYDLFTRRINPKNGKTQELQVDFIIAYLLRADSIGEYLPLDGSVKNLAYVTKIENKLLNDSSDAMRVMSLDSRLKGKELFVINGETVSLEAIGNGYLIGEGAVSDSVYLLSSGGKILANLDAMTTYTEKYILTDTGIYDYQLNKLVDLTSTEYRYKTKVGNALIFSEEVKTPATDTTPASTVTNYYLYNGSFNKIADGDSWRGSIDSYYYSIVDTPDPTDTDPYPASVYSYYDASGKLLFTSKGSSALRIASTEDCEIVQVSTADGNAYYRLKK